MGTRLGSHMPANYLYYKQILDLDYKLSHSEVLHFSPQGIPRQVVTQGIILAIL